MSNDIPQVIVNNLYPNKISIQMTDDLLINEKEKENVTTSKFNKGRWNSEEHKKFIVGILEYGNDWKKVQKLIKTRSSTQARSHAQKFFLRIKNDLKITEDKSILLNNKEISERNENFSIKFFFDLLNNFDKSNLQNGQKKKKKKKKLMNILSNCSNVEETISKEEKENHNNKETNKNINNNKIIINTLDLSDDKDNEVNIPKKKVKKIKENIFNIKKDNSNKENSKKSHSTLSESLGNNFIEKKRKENFPNSSSSYLNYLDNQTEDRKNDPFIINFELFENNMNKKNEKDENNSLFDLNNDGNGHHEIILSNFNGLIN